MGGVGSYTGSTLTTPAPCSLTTASDFRTDLTAKGRRGFLPSHSSGGGNGVVAAVLRGIVDELKHGLLAIEQRVSIEEAQEWSKMVVCVGSSYESCFDFPSTRRRKREVAR